jgi:uncharacterized protein YcgI (DUF1989 family)
LKAGLYFSLQVDNEMTNEILQGDRELADNIPSIPGTITEYVYVPARGFLCGRLLKKGQVIRIVDVLGKQCADTVIWDASNLDNVLNCCMSMMINGKWSGWKQGDVLYSKHCEALAVFGQDSTDGTHAALGAFCNEAFWHKLTGIRGCPNCRDNLVAAMADYDFRARDMDWSSCITLFMSVEYQADGSITSSEPLTKPGDYVDLVAERDIIVALSNCPGERSQSADNPTPLQAIIFNPDAQYPQNPH